MFTFVSWNLGKYIPADSLARIAAYRKADCLLVAGSAGLAAPLLETLGRGWECLSDSSEPQETALIARQGAVLPDGPVVSTMNGRLQIIPLRFRRGEPILLAHTYLSEPCFFPTDPQLRDARAAERALTIANCLRDAEETTGIRRTILVGDLRLPPYHPSVMGMRGLYATMSRELAAQAEITGAGVSRRRFFNPMWSLLGDRDGEPCGTDFVPCDEDGPGWHIYNQVLLRPELADSVRELRILNNDGRELLVTPRGVPDCSRGIYHLPVLCRLQK